MRPSIFPPSVVLILELPSSETLSIQQVLTEHLLEFRPCPPGSRYARDPVLLSCTIHCWQCDEMFCGHTVELALRIPLGRVSSFSLFFNLRLKKEINLYNNCEKDLEITYELLAPSLFKPFRLLKATDMVERILGIIAKQTLVQILAQPVTSSMTWKKSLKFSESLMFIFLEAVELNKRLALGVT